ncbi:MAG: type II secretion system F family protein, partial [Sphingomonadaceae bacterium]|nr:type II secretion system F family protein [Sphingomonadaceae bacterium]
MAAFTYRAVDSLGQAQRGVIEASSPLAARRSLRERNLVPIAVAATAGDAPAGRLPQRRARVGAKALAVVTRQLATLVGTDIRIEEALRLVAAGASPAIAELLLNVRGGILDGRSFAAALGEHPAAFPEFYRASVAAGETSGRLDQVLAHLADFVE